MFRDLFVDGLLFRNGIGGFLIPLVIILMISGFGLLIADNVGVEPMYGSGMVTNTKFVPAHTTTSTSQDINGNWTTTTDHHPDAWYMTVKLKGKAGTVEVSYDVFNRYTSGDKVGVMYIYGRVTGGMYIRSIETD